MGCFRGGHGVLCGVFSWCVRLRHFGAEECCEPFGLGGGVGGLITFTTIVTTMSFTSYNGGSTRGARITRARARTAMRRIITPTRRTAARRATITRNSSATIRTPTTRARTTPTRWSFNGR